MKVPGAVLVRRGSAALFALCVALGATLASAQTVVVRHAPPGSTVELVIDATPAGTAKADASGNAIVTTSNVDGARDASVWLDSCDGTYRVILARPGATLVPAGVCRRVQIPGIYLLQRVTSIVVDSSNTGSLLIRQGRPYDEWLTDPRPQIVKAGEEAGTSPASEPLPPLTGLTLFGAAGLGTALNFESQSCGSFDCSREAPIQYGGGVAWWFTDFLAVEGQYGYLGKLTVGANPSGVRFSATREGGFLAFGGRAGLRAGRFRPFGRAGLSLGRATVTTTQTVGDSTQTSAMRARGWAPLYGGGLEIWLSPRLGLYVDGQRVGLKGKDDRGSGLEIDDTLLKLQAGLTIRFP